MKDETLNELKGFPEENSDHRVLSGALTIFVSRHLKQWCTRAAVCMKPANGLKEAKRPPPSPMFFVYKSCNSSST